MGRWLNWMASLLIVASNTLWAETPFQDTAQGWLQRMVQASQTVSYQGQSVLLSGGQLTSLSIYHAPVEGQVWERVVHMNGEPAEIIRKGREVICLHRDKATRLAPVGPLMAFGNGLDEISKYYNFQKVADSRVAGRAAYQIDVLPKDKHRYGYSLWLDREFGILLKSQTNVEGASPLEVFEFVSVEVGNPLSAADFQPGSNLGNHLKAKSKSQYSVTPELPWNAVWLPEGFLQVKSFMQPEGEAIYSARVFSDGLAAFTVFYDNGTANQSIRFRGATVAVNHNANGGSVTVVGEIPLATAQKVAQSVNALASNP